MNGEYTRWVCWHPKLGFLRFGSYSAAVSSDSPDPRGCFAKEAHALARKMGTFWCGSTEYQGSTIEVKQIHFTWRAI